MFDEFEGRESGKGAQWPRADVLQQSVDGATGGRHSPVDYCVLGGNLTAGDSWDVLPVTPTSLVVEHTHGLVALGELARERRLAGRLGAEEAHAPSIVRSDQPWNLLPVSDGIATDAGGRDRHLRTVVVDRNVSRTGDLGEPKAVGLECEHAIVKCRQ